MIVERKDTPAPEQSLFLRNRNLLEIRGVTDVLRFDEETVVLATVDGTLTVEGSALHVQTLNLEQGSVTVDGRVDSLLYFDRDTNGKGEKSGFFGRLFH